MILIEKEQAKEVQYLLELSYHGNHILFTNEEVKRAFKTPPSSQLSEHETRELNSQIEKLMSIKSFLNKRDFISTLPQQNLNKVIQLYFNIIENQLFDAEHKKH